MLAKAILHTSSVPAGFSRNIRRMFMLLPLLVMSDDALDCGDSLYLTNDTLYTVGYAETEKGDFYFGFDFTAEKSYCSPDAPATEIVLAENHIKFEKVQQLPKPGMSSCTYVFGRDFFLSHKLDFDRTYHGIYIADDEMESISGTFNLTEEKGDWAVAMNGSCDLSNALPLTLLRHGGQFESIPAAWKTSRDVGNFALTSDNWPVWYTTGRADRFGLSLIPGNYVRIDLAAKKISYNVGDGQDLELILGEYAGAGEVFRVEADRLFFFHSPQENEPESEDEEPNDEVLSIGGTPASTILSNLKSDHFGTIKKLRRATELVWKAKDGTHKTASLDADPDA